MIRTTIDRIKIAAVNVGDIKTKVNDAVKKTEGGTKGDEKSRPTAEDSSLPMAEAIPAGRPIPGRWRGSGSSPRRGAVAGGQPNGDGGSSDGGGRVKLESEKYLGWGAKSGVDRKGGDDGC